MSRVSQSFSKITKHLELSWGCGNYALLSSVIPHTAVLKMFFNHKANSPPGLDQSSSTTLAENIKEAFKRRFYTTNKSTWINLLLTTSDLPDPLFRIRPEPDPDLYFQIEILPELDPDLFVKLRSCRIGMLNISRFINS